jgi:hypothetical protein
MKAGLVRLMWQLMRRAASKQDEPQIQSQTTKPVSLL